MRRVCSVPSSFIRYISLMPTLSEAKAILPARASPPEESAGLGVGVGGTGVAVGAGDNVGGKVGLGV